MGSTRTAAVGGPPGSRAPERRAALPGTVSCLGDLATPAVRVPPSTRLAALDALFRRHADLRWVVSDGGGFPRPGGSRVVRRPGLRAARPPEDAAQTAGRPGPAPAPVLPVAAAAADLLPLRTVGGTVEAVVVTWPDGGLGVASLPAVFEQVAQQALHDPLTGLPNRLFLLQRLAQQEDAGVGVLCAIGLDRFTDAPIGMALTALDGSFLRVNSAFEALVGWTTEQLDGLRVPDITHPADRANVAGIEAGRAVVQEVRRRYRRPDGSDVPVVVHATVVHGRRGEPPHVFAHVLPQ